MNVENAKGNAVFSSSMLCYRRVSHKSAMIVVNIMAWINVNKKCIW